MYPVQLPFHGTKCVGCRFSGFELINAYSGLNYLVEIDEEGRLRWARNHEPVDTTAGRWKDSEDGGGIIADVVTIRRALLRGESLQSTTSRDSAELDNAATHYTGEQKGNKVAREFRKRFTLHGVVDRLLRKTVRRNTWIYVSVNLAVLFLFYAAHFVDLPGQELFVV
ncbi:hypothetical protein B0H16DRAFT_1401368 [Mycena metata]|uniref:Uncharacterized protein n=1 Tax=Mycena metata TaxID=1033252 RepID=A0AAD7P3I6_9AGAR|nr:hypothetical protein B0H16DRAFT_1401368 [Mycena metata]